MKNWVNWFEIPAADFNRAVKFYSAIFNVDFHTMDMMGTKMAMFPSEGAGGAIVAGDDYKPATDGTLVYLNGGDDLNGVFNKVETNGGKAIVPKTMISEDMGYFAMFIDTEGNKIALHSMK